MIIYLIKIKMTQYNYNSAPFYILIILFIYLLLIIVDDFLESFGIDLDVDAGAFIL